MKYGIFKTKDSLYYHRLNTNILFVILLKYTLLTLLRYLAFNKDKGPIDT